MYSVWEGDIFMHIKANEHLRQLRWNLEGLWDPGGREDPVSEEVTMVSIKAQECFLKYSLFSACITFPFPEKLAI